MDIRIEPYSEIYVSEHQDFARKMWPDKQRRRVEEYNRWKFRGPLTGPVEGLLLALYDNHVVGQLGLIPVSLRNEQGIFPAQWACDLIVDLDYRRMGIASLLFSTGLSRDKITLGSNPSLGADITMSKLGFKPLIGPSQLVFPIDWSHVLSWKIPSWLHSFLPFLKHMISPFDRFRINKLRTTNQSRVKPSEWRMVIPRVKRWQSRISTAQIIHDQDFLSWRCQGFSRYSPELKTSIISSHGYAVFEATSTNFFVYDWAASDYESVGDLFGFL
jgi:hypothetical protein